MGDSFARGVRDGDGWSTLDSFSAADEDEPYIQAMLGIAGMAIQEALPETDPRLVVSGYQREQKVSVV